MEDEKLLTAEEAQAHLGVSRATFWNFVKRHNVPKYRAPLSGKRLFFRASDLDAARRPVRIDGGEAPKAAARHNQAAAARPPWL